jgi:hypothetical protein
MIEIGEKLKCQDCGREFRWVPTSTIKPKRCRMCENRRLLERSSFARKNKGEDKTRKYTSSGNKPAKHGKTSKQKARDRADEWFSRFIRIKYAFKIQNGDVFCKCFIDSNVKPKHAKHFDNGHCFSRSFLLTRYEEDNCRPQNRSSNRFSGEADHYKFKDKLKAEIGEERFDRLEKLRKQEGQDTEEFYREQADKYRKLTNQLIKEKYIKKWW